MTLSSVLLSSFQQPNNRDTHHHHHHHSRMRHAYSITSYLLRSFWANRSVVGFFRVLFDQWRLGRCCSCCSCCGCCPTGRPSSYGGGCGSSSREKWEDFHTPLNSTWSGFSATSEPICRCTVVKGRKEKRGKIPGVMLLTKSYVVDGYILRKQFEVSSKTCYSICVFVI